MRHFRRFEQGRCAVSGQIRLAKPTKEAHDGQMGEKPLSIDEAPAQLGTIMGASPPDLADVPPPGMTAGSITVTRSNIKSSGSAAAAGYLPPKPFQPEPTRPGDPFPTGPLPTDTAMKKEAVTQGDAGGSEPAGLAVKDNGINVNGGAAMEGEPIPGIDIKLPKNPGGSAATAGPVKPDPTRPGDPPPYDDTPPPGGSDPSPGAAEGEPKSVTLKGSDGSTLRLTELPTDENVMNRVDEEDIDPDWSKLKP
jgi:hypothetical protein